MNLTAKFKRHLKKKIATTALIAASLAAFATLGDGGGKKAPIPAEKFAPKGLTLRTSYSYKGDNILSSSRPSKFIMLNTVVTYQKGNATYVVPLKKKVFLDKVKFNPAPAKF